MHTSADDASLHWLLLLTVSGMMHLTSVPEMQATAAVLYGVLVVLQALTAIQLQTFVVYLTPTQDLAYVIATG